MTQMQVETLGMMTQAWQYGSLDGAPVILVHGFRGDHHGLAGVAEAIAELAPELRLIVPDLPGFGSTPPVAGAQHDLPVYGRWLEAFIAQVTGGEPYALLGHSFGSLVVAQALSSLSSAPMPQRLMLINPISSPALAGPQRVLTQGAIAYYRLAALMPERLARGVLGCPAIVRLMSSVMARTSDPELRRWIHDQHATFFSGFHDSQTLLQAFEASVRHTVRDFSAAFTMPTLIVAGEHDDIAPLPNQLRLAREISDATLRVVPHSGHLVHYEAVETAAVEIVNFLRSRSPQPAKSPSSQAATS